MICPNCNSNNPDGSVFCQSCGATLTGSTPNPASVHNPPQADNKGLAIGALVMGIVGCVLCWIPYVSMITLALTIVGLVLAIKARKTMGSQGIVTAGLVLCIIGLVLSAIGFITCTLPAFALCGLASTLPNYYY